FIPYLRYRATHLSHHNDQTLTDPRLDPESFYLMPSRWEKLPRALRAVLHLNNTLVGRLILGPPLWVVAFLVREARMVAGGDRRCAAAWARHLASFAIVYAWLDFVGLNIFLYAAAVAYPALSLINLRTFAEHRAHASAGPRSAIVHTSRFFSLLFLNNNLHYVHHKFPAAPWYRLPQIYRAKRQSLEAENGGYVIEGYFGLLRRYGLTQKEPVRHPLLPVSK
ncbi:MAG: fatty acid desaturase, partial [Alphaproteobacteria bacterium]